MAEAEVMVLSALQDLQDGDSGGCDGEEFAFCTDQMAPKSAFSMATKQTSATKADLDSARRVLSSFRSNSIGRLS